MSEGKTKRRGPRPRGPFQDKRRTLTTRITEPVRIGLEEAAAITERSLSQEIEFRLEQSLMAENALGGRRTAAVLRLLAARLALVTDDDWPEDWPRDYVAFMTVLDDWTRALKGIAPKPSDKVIQDIKDVRARFDAMMSKERPDILDRQTASGYADLPWLPSDLRAKFAEIAKADAEGETK